MADTGVPTGDGYDLWMACSCGAELQWWVTPEEAEDDLLWSGLTAFLN